MFIKYFLIFKILLTIWLAHHNDTVIMKFTNYICENMNESIVEIHQCRLRAVKRNIVTLNFNATLLKPALRIRVEAEFFQKANGYKPWLYKFDIDGCKYLRRAYNPIAKLTFNDALKFSNINHSCPIEGPLLFQGYSLRHEDLRLPLPTGDYLVNSKWHFNDKLAIIAKYYFSFEEDFKGRK